MHSPFSISLAGAGGRGPYAAGRCVNFALRARRSLLSPSGGTVNQFGIKQVKNLKN